MHAEPIPQPKRQHWPNRASLLYWPIRRQAVCRNCTLMPWWTRFWRRKTSVRTSRMRRSSLRSVRALRPAWTVTRRLETMRGHTLGRVLYTGSPLPNTGVPGVIGGHAAERVLRAPADGLFEPCREIGDLVETGDTIAYVAGKPMKTTITGCLRGLLQAGVPVHEGMKSGDVDPRGKRETAIPHPIRRLRSAAVCWKRCFTFPTSCIKKSYNRGESPMKKNCFARFAAAALSLAMLAGCGASQSSDSAAEDTGSADSVELTVFAAASMTETLNQIAEDYKSVDPNVTLTFNFASSGDLLTQIKEGADCDVFISAAPKQMNALDGSLKGDTDKNPDGLDELLGGTRIDLLENKVTLAVPEGNPKGVQSFDDLAEKLKSGDVLLAIGNSDVPVGQYTQKIFAHYGLDEAALAFLRRADLRLER